MGWVLKNWLSGTWKTGQTQIEQSFSSFPPLPYLANNYPLEYSNLGIQIRNMKMVFNFYCTWH